MWRLLASLCFVFLISWSSYGQDSQFSQFYANPLYLNPALTGAHSGTFRLMASYRDQWRGAIEKPFTTLAAGGDIKFKINTGQFSDGNDFFSAGILFFSDRQKIFEYNTTAISLFGAYHKLLSKNTNQYLSAGFQMGIGQRGINYENLTFQDQFDGISQYNQPTGEFLPANSIVYPDFAIGIHYAITPRKNQGVYVGLSYYHWNQPDISFFNRDLRTTQDYNAFKLNSKLSAHISTSFSIDRSLAIQPRAIFISQGKSSTAWIGSNFRFEFLDSDGVSMHLGSWLRITDSLTTYEPSDLVFSAGFEKDGLLIGFSYDTHLRKLSDEFLGQGVFELSISYIGEHENESQICPEF